MLNYPAKGSFEDWLGLSTLPKQPIDLWEHPIIVEMREVLQTRQAGIDDASWNTHQACKKDEVLRQMLLNWPAGIDMQLEELEIAEWEDAYGDNCIGTRLKSNQKEHGIVRKILGGRFFDMTFVEGVQEGIEVDFWASSRVIVSYYENGKEQSRFHFKPLDGFKESNRDGEKLSHLTAEHFDPNFDSQAPEQTTYKPSQIVREAESERITALEKFREAHRSQGAVGGLFGKK
jgi:hypothetical protein